MKQCSQKWVPVLFVLCTCTRVHEHLDVGGTIHILPSVSGYSADRHLVMVTCQQSQGRTHGWISMWMWINNRWFDIVLKTGLVLLEEKNALDLFVRPQCYKLFFVIRNTKSKHNFVHVKTRQGNFNVYHLKIKSASYCWLLSCTEVTLSNQLSKTSWMDQWY